jgi:hypothetical protein
MYILTDKRVDILVQHFQGQKCSIFKRTKHFIIQTNINYVQSKSNCQVYIGYTDKKFTVLYCQKYI